MVEHAVPVGKVYRAKDMLEDPHYKARQSLVEVESERWGHVTMQNVTPKLSATPGKVRWAGPEELGQDTDAVLQELLEMSPEQIEQLRSQGVI